MAHPAPTFTVLHERSELLAYYPEGDWTPRLPDVVREVASVFDGGLIRARDVAVWRGPKLVAVLGKSGGAVRVVTLVDGRIIDVKADDYARSSGRCG